MSSCISSLLSSSAGLRQPSRRIWMHTVSPQLCRQRRIQYIKAPAQCCSLNRLVDNDCASPSVLVLTFYGLLLMEVNSHLLHLKQVRLIKGLHCLNNFGEILEDATAEGQARIFLVDLLGWPVPFRRLRRRREFSPSPARSVLSRQPSQSRISRQSACLLRAVL